MKVFHFTVLQPVLHILNQLHEKFSQGPFYLDQQLAYCNGILIIEATISDLQSAMTNGSLTSVQLTQCYLDRIAQIDPFLNSVIETNPDALEIASELDDERKEHRLRGPLHGIPILLKDNIASRDKMRTTAGSLAMVNATSNQDAKVVTKLRRAGAVILGKNNLSEFAGFRSAKQLYGWSGRGGQCRSPYVLSSTPLGSSSGSAVSVAANLAVAAIGTETDGSIVAPASRASCVGIKPTVQLTSQDGVIPVSNKQDSVGVLARTVKDASTVLDAIVERPEERSSLPNHWPLTFPEFSTPLNRSLRVGVLNKIYEQPNISNAEWTQLNKTLAILRTAGVTIVNDIDNPYESFGNTETLAWIESRFIIYQLKSLINEYFSNYTNSTTDRLTRVKSLADIIQFNKENADNELQFIDQELLIAAENVTAQDEKATGEKQVEFIDYARRTLSTLLDRYQLDALLLPSDFHVAAQRLSSLAGYPVITVPSGFDDEQIPFGTMLTGKPLSEPVLLHLSQILEGQLQARKPPFYLKCCSKDDISII